MAASNKVIITCAATGANHTPSMSPHLPITPAEIAAHSIAAAEAGASIIHPHARDPEDGRPTPDPAVFMRFLPVIKQSADAVINITTGGGLGMTLDGRLAAPSVKPGSIRGTGCARSPRTPGRLIAWLGSVRQRGGSSRRCAVRGR